MGIEPPIVSCGQDGNFFPAQDEPSFHLLRLAGLRIVSSRNVFRQSPHFMGWPAFASRTCGAERRGIFTIVQNPTLHPRRWQREMMTECDNFNLNWRKCVAALPEPFIHRMQCEFELCDTTVVLSSVARQSFERFSYAGKVSALLPGVDHLFFSPPAKPRQSRLFSCLVWGTRPTR